MSSSNVITTRSKNLESIVAFFQDEQIRKLLNYCSFDNDLKDNWKYWEDNYKNVLKLDSKKNQLKLELVYEPDLELTNDLYCFSKPQLIAENSSKGFIKFEPENAYLWLLGRDNKLRIIKYNNNGSTENLIPIYFGLKCVKKVISELMDISDLFDLILMEKNNLSNKIMESFE